MEAYESSQLYRIRHSAAHIMAQAVLELFPTGKIAIGPPIADGFYYDFDLPRTLTPDDLEQIEARMRESIAADYPFDRRVVSAPDARHLFANQPFKLELIEDIVKRGTDEYGKPTSGGAELSTYRHDGFEDLCRGPHLERTGQIDPDAFKLLHTSGAYWRGDEHHPMLQRIYGTAWETPEQLEAYLWRQEEARKRDHRRLGRELGLWSFHAESPGAPFWLPKGMVLRQTIEDFLRVEMRQRGYLEIRTPIILDRSLWERSGHWSLYKENMYTTAGEDHEYGIKPMNCLGSYLVYKEGLHSFRDLPLRLAEITGLLHRFELSGVLTGLLRVREFVQDDTHIFIAPEQLEDELERVLDFAFFILRSFGFEEFAPVLSVRDPARTDKFLGTDAQWEDAERRLQAVAQRRGLEPTVAEGEAKFYGPSLDIMIRDALGREWQTTTIQIDFNAPERFDLEYIGSDGQPHRPLVLHRALIGSFERFMAVLTEHYGGAFPVWLAPIQAIVIPIADRHLAYAEEVADQLRTEGLRVEVDRSSERINAKIRDAQIQKIPYMLVVGNQEQAGGRVSVRLRSEENLGPMPLDQFLGRAKATIAQKTGI